MWQRSATVALLLAPASSFAGKLHSRDLAPATGLSGGWKYSGCYVDVVASRALSYAFRADTKSNSAESCTAFCAEGGYQVAGVEWTSECVSRKTAPLLK